ncbi:MAG: PqqD family protein [Burkholderiales bacterium]
MARPANALSIQSVGQELLILDQEAGLIHQLNETAALIWRKCEAGHSPREVAQHLVESYEIGEEVASREVVETLEKLRALNLVCNAD